MNREERDGATIGSACATHTSPTIALRKRQRVRCTNKSGGRSGGVKKSGVQFAYQSLRSFDAAGQSAFDEGPAQKIAGKDDARWLQSSSAEPG